MQKFKIAASKSSKKYNLILAAQSESEARERIHKEGYSILSLQVADEREIQGTKFIFHILSGEQIKKGVIVGEDIFKSYVKLRKDLGYQVKYLYPEGDEAYLDDEKKARIIHDLEQGYALKIESQPVKKEKVVTDAKQTQNIDKSFYLKNELENTHALIEKVLVKLNSIITDEKNYNLSPEKKEKLRIIFNNITKLKKSTNISKLKEVGELALVKIGDIELQSLELKKDKESKQFLTETNKLLKNIGSGKQFHEKSRDINYIISSFVKSFKGIGSGISFKEFFSPKKEKELIDKESYSFLKTLLLLEKYNEKLKETNKELLKNIGIFFIPGKKNIEKKEKILIKRKVIQQNITLLKAKKQGSIGSYTSLIKGYHKVFEIIGQLISSLSRVFFFVVLFYSFVFIIYLSLVRLGYNFSGVSLNYEGLLYFLFIILLVALTSVSRGVIMFCINVVFFVFILIFSVVNF